jgi:hypothetical protein
MPSILAAADTPIRKPVAEVLGKAVFEEDLAPPKADAEQKAESSPADNPSWYDRTARGIADDGMVSGLWRLRA